MKGKLRISAPKECCLNVSNGGPFEACGQQASHWYKHNDDICSYCNKHNYVCGEVIIPVDGKWIEL
jgi:hypothetical protein